jgi:hypothetical protein
MFFAQLSQQLLHGIRVPSREELAQRLLAYLDWLNQDPVPFRWKWKPEDAKSVDAI